MDNRNEYVYVLSIGGEIKKVIAKWWSTPQEMRENMAAMHAATYIFKKTAAILVYEHKNGDRWEFADAFQEHIVRKPQEITITEDYYNNSFIIEVVKY